jgi:hypothetical protein
MRPRVGSVMRLRILSSVLLPAPFLPMMPTTSPFPTSNDTSRSAQKSSVVTAADREPLNQVSGAAAAAAIDSRSV